MKFDPRLRLRTPRAFSLDTPAPNLGEIGGALSRFFPEGQVLPRLAWAKVRPSAAKVELVSVTKAGVMVHPIVSSRRLPAEVREAIVFLGVLLHVARVAQQKPRGHVLDHPALAEWVDRTMGLHPSAGLLERFLGRFEVWIETIGKTHGVADPQPMFPQ